MGAHHKFKKISDKKAALIADDWQRLIKTFNIGDTVNVAFEKSTNGNTEIFYRQLEIVEIGDDFIRVPKLVLKKGAIGRISRL